MRLRFQVGDVAVLGFAIGPFGRRRVGEECEIMEIGPFSGQLSKVNGLRNVDGDYVIRFHDGAFATTFDRQLRKKRPPIPTEVLKNFKEREVTG